MIEHSDNSVTQYETETGSIYEVDSNVFSARKVGGKQSNHRVNGQWKVYESIYGGQVGEQLVIVWGRGRDANSENALQIGDAGASDAAIIRTTVTSRIVKRTVTTDFTIE